MLVHPGLPGPRAARGEKLEGQALCVSAKMWSLKNGENGDHGMKCDSKSPHHLAYTCGSLGSVGICPHDSPRIGVLSGLD